MFHTWSFSVSVVPAAFKASPVERSDKFDLFRVNECLEFGFLRPMARCDEIEPSLAGVCRQHLRLSLRPFSGLKTSSAATL
jgi:hypothetical protein